MDENGFTSNFFDVFDEEAGYNSNDGLEETSISLDHRHVSFSEQLDVFDAQGNRSIRRHNNSGGGGVVVWNCNTTIITTHNTCSNRDDNDEQNRDDDDDESVDLEALLLVEARPPAKTILQDEDDFNVDSGVKEDDNNNNVDGGESIAGDKDGESETKIDGRERLVSILGALLVAGLVAVASKSGTTSTVER